MSLQAQRDGANAMRTELAALLIAIALLMIASEKLLAARAVLTGG